MPLLVICGIPGSGKSTRAEKLKEYLEENHKVDVVIVSEETLTLDKNTSYSSVIKEKECRGFLRSNVEKNLDNQTVVILDSLNYIKGYRYELFCLARTAKSTHAVMFCNTSYQTAKEWNGEHENNYHEELFEDLCKRMEQPNPKNRWDSPLFFVNEDQETPFEDIAQTLLFNKKKAKDPISTKQEFIKSGNYVYDLDKVMQAVLDKIIKMQNEYSDMNPGVDRILMKIPFEDYKTDLVLKRVIPIGDLKQFKREFLEMNKINPFSDMKKAAIGFIEFIQYYEDDY